MVVDPTHHGAAWRAIGELAGFETDDLPVATSAAPPADIGTLRLIAESSGVHVDHDALVELAEEWGKALADGGYDVIGDVHDLVPLRPGRATDPARVSLEDRVDILNDALAEAVAEIGRLRLRLSAAARRPRRPSGR